MRLSRPRVLLRVVLLAVGGAFMLWRALEGRRALESLRGSEAALASRLSLVWALMGVLALVTAATAAFALRPRRRRRPLELGSAPQDPARPGAPPPRETDSR
jgi:hypothetical protein